MSNKALLPLICFIGLLPPVAFANEPPELISSNLPEYVLPELPFLVEVAWEDREGDFIVDVNARFRPLGQADWSEVVLDFSEGSNPLSFSRSLAIDGIGGEYEVQVKASNSLTPDGSRFNTTDWISLGRFDLFSASDGSCVGTIEGWPPDATAIPLEEVSIQMARNPVDEGASVNLSVSNIPLGEPFAIRWCVSLGRLETNPDLPDLKQVTYRPPLVPTDKAATLSLEIANAGYATKTTSEILIEDLDGGQAPNFSITSLVTPETVWVGTDTFVGFRTSPEITTFWGEVLLNCDSNGWLPVADFVDRQIVNFAVPDSAISCQARVRVTDGISDFVQADSETFHVFSNRQAIARTIDQAGSDISGVDLLLNLGDGTDRHLRTGDEGLAIFQALSGPGTLRCTNDWDCSPESFEIVWDEQLRVLAEFVVLGTSGSITTIDIKPGSSINPINPTSRGKIPVAILSTPDFDAPSQVVLTSLTFGRTGAEDSLHYRGNGDPNCSTDGDHNDDGLPDVKCRFETQKAAFQSGDTEGILRGQTIDGDTFEAKDTITIVGPGHDEDADGVSDDIEDAAPNSGDANGDGILDSLQLNVTSLVNHRGGYFSLVSSPDCTNAAVTPVSPEDLPKDSGNHAVDGLLSFELHGCSTSETMLYIHSDQSYSAGTYRRYGPQNGGSTSSWYTLPADFSTTLIDGATVSTASFTLVDGGIGDDDGVANGVIVDPGGPTLRALAIPTASNLALWILMLLLGSGAMIMLRRR